MSGASDLTKHMPPLPTRPQINRDIRTMAINALHNAGGEKYLERQAHANPVAFMGLLGKILPAQMRVIDAGATDRPVEIKLSWLEPGRRFSGGWRDRPAEALPEPVEAAQPLSGVVPPADVLDASEGPTDLRVISDRDVDDLL